MFVRKKLNRSGSISVVVVSKAHGNFTEVKKFGVAKSAEEAEKLLQDAHLCFAPMMGNKSLTLMDILGKSWKKLPVLSTM